MLLGSSPVITVVFIFSVLHMKYHFFILVSLSWNLVPKIIQMCKILFWFFHFYRLLPDITFLTNLFEKTKILNLSQNLISKRIRILTMMLFMFFVLDWKTIFGAYLVPKFKTIFLKWNLLPRLIRTCNFDHKYPF